MTGTHAAPLWRQIEDDTAAAGWLIDWADHTGPLAHLPTWHPAVHAIMRARYHLLVRANTTRKQILCS
jgi:hypothetical protein